MITMTNVLKRGRTVWDRALLPEDEYVERTRVLRDAMADGGLDVLVSLGHSTRPGNFTYLSGYVPPLGWMSTVLGAERGPMLVSGGGSREIPFVKTQTWIEELRTSRSLFAGPAEAVADAIAVITGPGARVGVAGAHYALNAVTRSELADALSAYEVVAADELMETTRMAKRPREIVALRQSATIARLAVDAAMNRFGEGASATEAILAAEYTGRHRGCRDVHVLGDLGNGQLAPVEALSDDRGERFSVYCAVEYLGYWGQAVASTAESSDASAALEAMIAAASPGVELSALASAALAALPADAVDLALSYGLGGGIGLDPSESPEVSTTSSATVAPGTVLALQTIVPEGRGLGGAAATLLVTEEGITPL